MDELIKAIEKQQAAIDALAEAARDGEGKNGWHKGLELWQFLLAAGGSLVVLIVWGARLPGPADLDELERKVQRQSDRVTRLEEAAGRSADRAQFVRELADKLDQLKQTVEDTRRDVAVLRARSEKGR